MSKQLNSRASSSEVTSGTEDVAAQTDTLSSAVNEESTRESIAQLAYALWQQKGCPPDSSDQDWVEAEETLRQSEVRTLSAGA